MSLTPKLRFHVQLKISCMIYFNQKFRKGNGDRHARTSRTLSNSPRSRDCRGERDDRFTCSCRLFGAVGGVGLEVAFLRNVSAKVEYNAFYLPTETLHWVSPDTTSEIKHFVQVVKAGINVRFNGDGGLPR